MPITTPGSSNFNEMLNPIIPVNLMGGKESLMILLVFGKTLFPNQFVQNSLTSLNAGKKMHLLRMKIVI